MREGMDRAEGPHSVDEFVRSMSNHGKDRGFGRMAMAHSRDARGGGYPTYMRTDYVDGVFLDDEDDDDDDDDDKLDLREAAVRRAERERALHRVAA